MDQVSEFHARAKKAMAKGKVIKMSPSPPPGPVESGRENGLQTIQKQYNTKLTQALHYKAVTQKDYEAGGELLSVFKSAEKAAKAEKAKTLDPAELTVKRIKEQWKPFETGLTAAVKHIKDQMSAYLQAQEAERLRILADKRLKPETKLDRIATMPTTSNTRGDLKLFIDNENLIPREYLVIDEVKLKAALKEGVVVPGARLERVKTVVAR